MNASVCYTSDIAFPAPSQNTKSLFHVIVTSTFKRNNTAVANADFRVKCIASRINNLIPDTRFRPVGNQSFLFLMLSEL